MSELWPRIWRSVRIALLASVVILIARTPTNSSAYGQGLIATVAGGGVGNGVAVANATLTGPYAVALDGSGHLYITDSSLSDKNWNTNNCLLREVSAGTISTVAGNGSCVYGGDGSSATSAGMAYPWGVALDGAGDIYVADWGNCRVREISSGIITTVAGSGVCGYGGDGGNATSAQMSNPAGLALDGSGNLYVSEWNGCRVREVAAGIITTVAGNGSCSFGGDGGPATSASIENPAAVAFDGAGNLYIVDTYECRVRKVSNGIISTVAGNGSCTYGGDGGLATAASLAYPKSVTLDNAGDLYIADTSNNRVREVSSGIITTVAGGAYNGYGGDGGPATTAELQLPTGVVLDGTGNLYIADNGNCRVREVTGGSITTFAGAGCRYGGDGGPATSASLNFPAGVAVDFAGNLFIADELNCRVRQVSAGTITTVAGNGSCGFGGDGGLASAASLFQPASVAVDGSGNLYIADTGNSRVREVSGGVITTVAGGGTCCGLGDGGPATSGILGGPSGVAVDATGNVFIADTYDCRVREVSAGIITTVAGNGSCSFGGDGGPATSAALYYPAGVAADSAGNLYIADSSNCRVRKVSGGTITTVAGTGSCADGGDGGPATSAWLDFPYGLALDGRGNLFIAVNGSCSVREVSGGTITTVAGDHGCPTLYVTFSGDGGPATSATLDAPRGVAVDRAGDLFVADGGNNRVRELQGPDGDADGDTDFSNPGPGLPCVQDHLGDTNHDGYSDADEATPPGAPTCTGSYPPTGGLGLNPGAPCPGRNLLGTPAQVTAAKIARADVDVNGRVNILDLSAAASAYQQSGFASNPNDRRNEFDQDGNGVINILDLAAMAAQYNKTVPSC